jgi:hypothetical protein
MADGLGAAAQYRPVLARDRDRESRRLPRSIGAVHRSVDGIFDLGVAGVCIGGGTINLASLLTDMYRALHLLVEDQHIDGSRTAVMWFSFGARSAIWTSHARLPRPLQRTPLDCASTQAPWLLTRSRFLLARDVRTFLGLAVSDFGSSDPSHHDPRNLWR